MMFFFFFGGYEDIAPGIRCCDYVEDGMTRGRNGLPKRKYRMVECFEINRKKVLIDDWMKLCEERAIENGDTELLEAITERARTQPWLKKEKDIRLYALECLANGSYKSWFERGEFGYADAERAIS